jgi:dihydrofolate synthase/folylpolyglutamate synthase
VPSLAAWLEQQQHSHSSAIDLGLERVSAVARRLGLLSPKHRVITVAGTNGKGSTVAYLDGVLRASGMHVGRFTSPHLRRYNERIVIDGECATDAALIASFERIEAARAGLTLTFFEYNTLAALDLFRAAQVDVAVLEVGLGGRLDATNMLDADVAVLCSIGLDHVDWLGGTLDAIGREKAGVMREGRPAVLATPEMPDSVWRAIATLGVRAVVAGRDFMAAERGEGWDFTSGDLVLRDLPRPRIRGSRQIDNAAAALAAVQAGLGLQPRREAVVQALEDTVIEGRFQIVTRDGVEWIFDVAHNVPAAEVLAQNLAALPAARTIAVCGILGDKDIGGIVRTLAPVIDEWLLAALAGPRALGAKEFIDRLPAGARVVATLPDVATACEAARASARPGDRVLVFGSFLTVGPALEFLGI